MKGVSRIAVTAAFGLAGALVLGTPGLASAQVFAEAGTPVFFDAAMAASESAESGDETEAVSGPRLGKGMFVLAVGTFALLASDFYLDSPTRSLTTSAALIDPANPESITVGITSAPEPASMALLATGLVGLAAARRRRKLAV